MEWIKINHEDIFYRGEYNIPIVDISGRGVLPDTIDSDKRKAVMISYKESYQLNGRQYYDVGYFIRTDEYTVYFRELDHNCATDIDDIDCFVLIEDPLNMDA